MLEFQPPVMKSTHLGSLCTSGNGLRRGIESLEERRGLAQCLAFRHDMFKWQSSSAITLVDRGSYNHADIHITGGRSGLSERI